MAERRTKTRAGRRRDIYLALVRRLPLRPIRSEVELDAAIAMIDVLTDRDELDAGEADYLDVLGDLVERYEDKAHPVPTDDLSDAEMLAHFIEAKGVKQVEVARATAISESTLSEVLRGKRQLTRGQIGKLAAYFGVGPGAFLTPDGEAGS
jgi:HTH-type transcriptional regulator/antitoxin HigA